MIRILAPIITASIESPYNVCDVNYRFYSEPRQGLISFVPRRNVTRATRAEHDRRRRDDGDRPWRHVIVIGPRLPGTPRRSRKGESDEFLERSISDSRFATCLREHDTHRLLRHRRVKPRNVRHVRE